MFDALTAQNLRELHVQLAHEISDLCGINIAAWNRLGTPGYNSWDPAGQELDAAARVRAASVAEKHETMQAVYAEIGRREQVTRA
jgi:hypothetical protein